MIRVIQGPGEARRHGTGADAEAPARGRAFRRRGDQRELTPPPRALSLAWIARSLLGRSDGRSASHRRGRHVTWQALRATVDYEQFVVTMRGLKRSSSGK